MPNLAIILKTCALSHFRTKFGKQRIRYGVQYCIQSTFNGPKNTMVAELEPGQKNQQTVKAFRTDIALINQRARGLGCSAAEVIHMMCENLRKEIYLQELGESFDLMKSKTKPFADFQDEQKAWDCALTDGLDDAR
jgi:hypothetical protein